MYKKMVTLDSFTVGSATSHQTTKIIQGFRLAWFVVSSIELVVS